MTTDLTYGSKAAILARSWEAPSPSDLIGHSTWPMTDRSIPKTVTDDISIDALVHHLAEQAIQISDIMTPIENLVRQKVREKIQGWIDTNLPTLVEREMRAGVERMTNRLA